MWVPAATLHGTVKDWVNVPVLETATLPNVVGVDAIATLSVVDGENAEPINVTVRPSAPTVAVRPTHGVTDTANGLEPTVMSVGFLTVSTSVRPSR